MRSCIEVPDLTVDDPALPEVRAFVEAGSPFWLDIEDPTDEVIDHIAVALGLHPLAVADSKQFGQRGKLELYGDVAMIVAFGLELEGPVEVHVYYTAGFLITLRRQSSSTLDELHRSGRIKRLLGGDPVRMLHELLTELFEAFRPVVDEMDDQLDLLEARVIEHPEGAQLVELARLKQRANVLRRTLTASRDVSTRSSVVLSLPGAGPDSALYLADLSEQLQLLVTDLAAVNDRSIGLIGLHSSLTSSIQGVASSQLAVIATVFLPITFVVGFFGMNFSVLVDDLQVGWLTFALFAIGLNALCIVVTMRLIRKRGWLDPPSHGHAGADVAGA